MNYINDVRAHITSLEHSKFIQIDDTRFPAISVTRIQYPESSSMPPVSTVEVFPKHAVIAYIANPEDISGGGGGSTSVTVNLSSTNNLLSVLTSQTDRIESLTKTITAQNAEKVTSWSTVSAAVTNSPVAFPSTPASLVSILNNTGVTILIQNGSNLPAFPLPYGGAIDIYTVSNANEIRLTREDGLSDSVSVYGVVTFRS